MEKYRVELTEGERAELLAVVGRGTSPAAKVRRANILLAVDRGEHADLMMTDAQAAAAYRASEQTVRNLKRQLVCEGLEAAVGRKARSRPGNVKIDGEAEARIVAMTCTEPPAGHARWTLRLIADESVRRGYVQSISHVAVGDLLKKTSFAHGWSRSGASPSAPPSS